MVLGYFTEEELISQLRLHFDYDEMWTINFYSYLSRLKETDKGLVLKIKNKTFIIDKITGEVIKVEED